MKDRTIAFSGRQIGRYAVAEQEQRIADAQQNRSDSCFKDDHRLTMTTDHMVYPCYKRLVRRVGDGVSICFLWKG